LLIEGEHPEYHAALTDPGFDGEIQGVNPRLHIAIHEVVATQLWEDDPAEAWRAAKRLRDAGVERHDVLHQLGSLGSVVTAQLHGGLTNRQAVDPAAYRQALDALRPPSSRRRATSAAVPVRGAVYQVKVTLHDAKPPIWRRLRLPAATTLAQLHQVIQVASAGRTLICTASRSVAAATPAPTSSCGTRPPTKARPGCRTWRPAPVLGCATPTTSATPGSTTSWSKRPCRLTGYRTPSASLVGEPGRPRTAAACGAMPSSATSLPTRTILADPDHPDHAERVEWLGHPYDPTAFDKDAVNAALSGIRLG
jgi:Plasmid pRiA4b ORF-3-like protein/Domain of unknown function (DUF1841)